MKAKEIWLPVSEYKKITQEINTNYSLYIGKRFAAHASVGIDGIFYIYYFVNNGFDEYCFVKKIAF